MATFKEAIETNDPNLFEKILDENPELYSSDIAHNPLYTVEFDNRYHAINYLIFTHPNPIPFFKILFEKNPSLLTKRLPDSSPGVPDGNTVLIAAVAGKRPDLATYFMDISPNIDFLNEKDTNPINQNTALILAIKTDDKDMALKLIKKGVNVNDPEKNGLTPLHWACMMHQDEVIHALLDAGADKTKLNDFGIPPVDYYQHQMSQQDFQFKTRLKNNKVILVLETETGEEIVGRSSYSGTEFPEFEDMTHHIKHEILFNRKVDPTLVQQLSYPGHQNKLEDRLKKILEPIQTAIRNWQEHGIGLRFAANDKIKDILAILSEKIGSLENDGQYAAVDLLENELKESLAYLDLDAGESYEEKLYKFIEEKGEEFGDINFLRELNSYCEPDFQKKISEAIDKIEAAQQSSFTPKT